MPGQLVNQGIDSGLSLCVPRLDEAERIYNELSGGGQIVHPFADTF